MNIGIANRRILKWSMAGSMLLFCLGLIWWNLEAICTLAFFRQARAAPLQAFDGGRPIGLNAVRRAELERELFSEVYMWNTWSRRYHGLQGLIQREQRWREMAQEGYELAYLTLTVLEPGALRVHNPLPALRRLDELARQGDSGAMCLMTAIVMQLPKRVGLDWAPFARLEKSWMQKGAELGHPECLAIYGGRLILGSEGFSRDVGRGMDMMFEAFRQGYTFWVSVLWIHLKERDLGRDAHRRLLYCWQYQDAQLRVIEPGVSLKVHLEYKAPVAQRESLRRELEQLQQWHPTIEECMKLTRQSEGERRWR